MNAHTSVSMCVYPCCMMYVHMFFSFSHDPHAHTALAHRPMSIKGKGSQLLIAVNPQRCVDVSKASQSLLKAIFCSSRNINLTDKFKKSKQTGERTLKIVKGFFRGKMLFLMYVKLHVCAHKAHGDGTTELQGHR